MTRRTMAVAALVSVLSASPVWAQRGGGRARAGDFAREKLAVWRGSAEIAGKITDETGKGVPDAKVTFVFVKANQGFFEKTMCSVGLSGPRQDPGSSPNRFFRVVKRQWAQFGINGDPKVSGRWRADAIPDDPPGQSNVRGRVAFAFKDPDGRTTQVYISLRDNSSQDALSCEYGETSGGGIRAGKLQPLFNQGNAYLDREYPRLDRLLKATVMR